MIRVTDNILNFPLFSVGKSVVTIRPNSLYPEWDEMYLQYSFEGRDLRDGMGSTFKIT